MFQKNFCNFVLAEKIAVFPGYILVHVSYIKETDFYSSRGLDKPSYLLDMDWIL